jgi:Family of unknown function (DUF6951)
MTKVQVKSGVCGFEAQIVVRKTEKRKVTVSVSSDCQQIGCLAKELPELSMMEVLKSPIHQNPVYEKAGQCGLHTSCPVPSGVLKAAEAELGLALKRDAAIEFQEKD